MSHKIQWAMASNRLTGNASSDFSRFPAAQARVLITPMAFSRIDFVWAVQCEWHANGCDEPKRVNHGGVSDTLEKAMFHAQGRVNNLMDEVRQAHKGEEDPACSDATS